jgi:predicted Zn-dependent peptidase
MIAAKRHVGVVVCLFAAVIVGCRKKPPDHAAFRLDNGLRVDLFATKAGETAALALLFDVGADHDPPGQSGMARLVEHLFTTAGVSDKPARTRQQLEQRYGQAFLSATGADFTLYAVEVPAGLITDEIDDVGLRMSRLSVTENDFTRERTRLLGELATIQTRDVSAAMNRAAESLRPSRGGGVRGGVAGEIAKLTRDQVDAFRQAHYGGSTAQLLITGRFDIDEISKRIRAAFGPALAAKAPAPSAAAGSRVTGTLVMSEAPTAMALAVPVPEPKDPLYAPFLVLAMRVTRGDNAARTWKADFAPLARPDILFVTAPLPTGQPPEAAAGKVRADVEGVVGAPLGGDEAAQAIDRFGELLSMTAMTAKTVAAGPFETAFAAGRRAQLGIDGPALAQALRAVTPDQLAAAAKLFGAANSTAVLMSAKPAPRP